ncbi:hypothetical protein [Pseudomonas chlororaphis]|uniref:hypothetical protein n=1 Tax=Pseudomonas chlororaphis TaxID=587753 RepID=UPI0012FD7BCE|nr:hypothetical protein [Pseudomonas chlororaphis]
MAFGRCKLTHQDGTFVDSHIIPQAFTKPEGGKFFIEGGPGRPLTRRLSSWYDNRLVVRKGENILADLDSFAAITLRENLMVWSGWAEHQNIPDTETDFLDGYGIRALKKIDHSRLRLFFLSLLWRAAASSRPEFNGVSLSPEDLEALRVMLISGESQPLDFIPVFLMQHSTLGPRHNLAPLIGRELRSDEDAPEIMTNSIRFYFDGLIVYFCQGISKEAYEEARNLFVGETEKVLISCVPFANSWQENNLKQHILDARRDWPSAYSKMVKS